MDYKLNFILGIDVSKKTIDVTIGKNEVDGWLGHEVFSNNIKGYDKMLLWIGSFDAKAEQCLVCLENTGIYHRSLAFYLQDSGAFVWLESGVEIKWSLGVQRGKNDKEDSKRIMLYAYRNQDKAKSYSQKDEKVQQISDLLSLRARMQKCIKTIKVPIKELHSIGLLESASMLEESTKSSIAALEKELKAIEQRIKEIIESDPELNKKYQYATSVSSIGFVCGVSLLVYTHGFTKFKSAKQLASFSGIAPFQYSSGTSIKRRTKVHMMGNRTLKTIIHLCAVSSIRNNSEMRVYYERKVSEGKNKMLVLNAIRNKLLARVFSCVKHEKMYVPYKVA